ncbi:hypothetical protein ACIRBX_30820 [Kitasatospora sp. NPDC096147]|uniref:hypothetical protein n=1 Tax=Kitasatospora sp. NPDC096147 TaxID=3364093 RepID=UPI003806B215
MSRPTLAHLSAGVLTVMVAAAVLLAVSGSRGVFEIAVLVGFAVALGTLTTALLVTGAERRHRVEGLRARRTSSVRASAEQAGSAARAPHPEYAARR